MATDPNPRWQINEGRLRSFRDKHRLIAFVCECGQSDCIRTVPLAPEEYEARRPGLILHEIHNRDPS